MMAAFAETGTTGRKELVVPSGTVYGAVNQVDVDIRRRGSCSVVHNTDQSCV